MNPRKKFSQVLINPATPKGRKSKDNEVQTPLFNVNDSIVSSYMNLLLNSLLGFMSSRQRCNFRVKTGLLVADVVWIRSMTRLQLRSIDLRSLNRKINVKNNKKITC